MKNYVRYAVLAVIAALILPCGCTFAEQEDPQPAVPALTLMLEELPVFESAGGSVTVDFTATSSWTAEVDKEWGSVSMTEGDAGAQSIILEVEENESEDERNATLIITSGTVTESLVIVQKQKNTLLISSERQEVGVDGGTVTIEVKSNVDFEYYVDGRASEWIKPVQTKALTTTQLEFSVAPNESGLQRAGRIIVEGSGLIDTVSVYQYGVEPVLVLSEDRFTVGSDGDLLVIEVRSNVPYEMHLPAEADWLNEAVARAVSTYTRYIAVAANDTYDSRSAEIVFESREYDLSDTVTVEQMQKDAIIVARNEYELGYEGNYLEFAVNANVSYEVTVTADWIQQVQTKAMVEDILGFMVSANSEDTPREAEIIFSSETGLRQSVKIIQKGTPVQNMLTISIYGDVFVSPFISGQNFAGGMIFWGDGDSEVYQSEVEHIYETPAYYSVEIATEGADKIVLSNIVGVKGLNISQF